VSTLMHPFDEGQGRKVVAAHAGPASYTVFSGGGDTINASEFLMKNLYHVAPAITTDGLYEVWPACNGVLAGQGSTVAAKWILISTGAEPAPGANLSASIAVLRAAGN